MKNHIIVISGPTASGKSDLALNIAQEVHGEIINADIGSMYVPLSVGTAKPAWKSEIITHHLFDILDQPVNFTVVQFRALVQSLIQEIWSRGHVPIIVGGSAFYIKSLFFRQHEIADSSDIVARLEQQVAQGLVDSLALWNKLCDIDFKRSRKIHYQDTYRIIRALAIFEVTGQKPSNFEQVFDPVSSFYFIICKRDRKDLYERIDARVHQMMNNGWLKEIAALQKTEWQNFLIAKKLIGYDDLLHYAQNEKQSDLSEVVATIQQKTRNYAKRQIIFLNKLEKDVKNHQKQSKISGFVDDINLTSCDVGLYIKGLSNRILQTLS